MECCINGRKQKNSYKHVFRHIAIQNPLFITGFVLLWILLDSVLGRRESNKYANDIK